MRRWIWLSCLCLLPFDSTAGNVRGEVATRKLAPLIGPVRSDAAFWRLGSGLKPTATEQSVLVVLEGPSATAYKAGPTAQLTMEIEGYGFWPAVLAARAGSIVRFVNRDDRPYSCYAEDGPDAFRLHEIKPAEEEEHKLLSPGVLHVRCHAYPFMRATILVLNSPLVARVNESGRFLLRNVPGGTYTARVFAGDKWRWDTQIRVASAGMTRLVLKPPEIQNAVDNDSRPVSPADTIAPVPIGPKAPKTEPGANEKPPVADKTPPKVDRKPPVVDGRPPTEDKKLPVVKTTPPIGVKKLPVAKTTPPAGENKPPARDKKPPVAKKRPPAGEKKPAKKKPKEDAEPTFEDVEPEIEIEIEE